MVLSFMPSPLAHPLLHHVAQPRRASNLSNLGKPDKNEVAKAMAENVSIKNLAKEEAKREAESELGSELAASCAEASALRAELSALKASHEAALAAARLEAAAKAKAEAEAAAAVSAPRSMHTPITGSPTNSCPSAERAGYDSILGLRRALEKKNRTSSRPLVVCPGQGSTATHTLAYALQHAFGMRVLHWRWPQSHGGGALLDPILHALNKSAPDAVDWVRLLSPFDAVLDEPIPSMFPFVLAAFPNARVLHTVRPTDEWLRSRVQHKPSPAPLSAWFAPRISFPPQGGYSISEVVTRSKPLAALLTTAHNLLVRCMVAPNCYREINAFAGDMCAPTFLASLEPFLGVSCVNPKYRVVDCPRLAPSEALSQPPLALKAAAARCLPSIGTWQQPQGALAPAPHSFYLDEGAGLNMSDVHACLDAELDECQCSYDDLFTPNQAEHMGDLHLLRQLRVHPARVSRPADALVHLTGITPSTSLFASQTGKCVRNRTHSHAFRMQRAAIALATRLANAPPNRRYVIVSSTPACSQAFTEPLLKVIRANLHRVVVGMDGLVHASGRPTAAHRDGWISYCGHDVDLSAAMLTVPYVASTRLDAAVRRAGSGRAFCDARQKRGVHTSFMFAGNMHREGAGSLRSLTMHRMAAAGLRALIVDHNFKSNMTIAANTEMAEALALRMLASRACLVPEGDTPGSRRLFDALAAGCLPVYLGDAKKMLSDNLPFTSSIDWRSIVLFAGNMSCLLANKEAGALALAEWLSQPPRSLQEEMQACTLRVDTYMEHLSYFSGGAAATALLQELYTRWIPAGNV